MSLSPTSQQEQLHFFPRVVAALHRHHGCVAVLQSECRSWSGGWCDGGLSLSWAALLGECDFGVFGLPEGARDPFVGGNCWGRSDVGFGEDQRPEETVAAVHSIYFSALQDGFEELLQLFLRLWAYECGHKDRRYRPLSIPRMEPRSPALLGGRSSRRRRSQRRRGS